MAAPAPQTVRGLAVSEARPDARPRPHGCARRERTTSRFRIADRAGRTVRDFDVEHTKRMHLIVVRRDMTGFQHLHPTQGADGSWTVAADAPRAGAYRVFADFSVGGRAADARRRPRASTAPLRSRAAPAAAPAPTSRRLRVRLDDGAPRAGDEAELRFTVTRDGRPVAVEPYLGADGHLVALREGDLAFLHVHPDARRPAASWPPSRPRAATACSCSSRSTAASTPPRSPRRSRDEHAPDVDLPITGMTCASCANRVERRLNRLDGVDRDGELRDRAGHGRVRPGGRRARAARRGRRGRRLPGDAALAARGRASRRRRGDGADERRRRCAAGWSSPAAAVAAGAAALDDPGAAVRQLAVARARSSRRRSSSGAPGRSTAPPGRTCATAPRRWTRSSRSACSPRGCGRCTRCSSATRA